MQSFCEKQAFYFLNFSNMNAAEYIASVIISYYPGFTSLAEDMEV